MKTSMIAIALALTTAAASVLAAPPGWGGWPGPGYAAGSGQGLRIDPTRIDRRIDRMTAALDLTETQRQEIRRIFEQRRDGQINTRAETHAAIAAVLNPEQRARLQQWRAQRVGSSAWDGYPCPRGLGTGYGAGRGPGWGPYPMP